MKLKETLRGYDFIRILLILWLISSFFVLFSLSKIDWIVHKELYNFGLRFSTDWAVPYWISLRVIYVWIAVPSALSAIFLGLDFWRKLNNRKPASEPKPKPILKQKELQPSKNNHMLVSCPSCKKIFRKPMVMLDFSSGKPRLVNVCPYCNAILGKATEEPSETIQVREPDREVIP